MKTTSHLYHGKRLFWHSTFSLICLGIGQYTIIAQDTSSEGEVFELSPFTVDASEDEGYMATQSLAGSRFAQDLRDIPAPIEVITSEVIDDLGVFDLQEVMDWSVNAMTANSTDVNGPEGAGLVDQERRNADIRIRGTLVTLSRNYFKWEVNSDKFNIDRIDTSRGPNAMLFGDSSLSGLANLTTKRAQFKKIMTIKLQSDSFGGGRGEFDVNLPIVDKKFAVRLNAFEQDTDQWRDFGQYKRDGIALAATWRPAKGLEIRFEGETGTNDDIFPKSVIRGRVSGWDHVTFVETPGSLSNAAAKAGGVTIEKKKFYMDATRLDDGIWNWIGNGISTGAASYMAVDLAPGNTLIPVLLNEPASLEAEPTYKEMVLPDFSYGALQMASRVKSDYTTYSLFIEKQFSSNFFAEVAANHQEQDRFWHVAGGGPNQVYYDLSKTLPNGYSIDGSWGNPNFLNPFISFLPTVRHEYVESDEIRALALYRIETDWFRQSVGVNVSYREAKGGHFRKSFSITNGSNPDLSHADNRPNVRYYLTDLGQETTYFQDGETYTVGDATLEFVNTDANAAGQAHSQTELKSVLAYLSGSWLQSQRLYTTLGIRRDSYVAASFNNHVWDDVTNVYIRSDLSEEVEDTIDSPSVGIVYHLTDWFSPYANFSKSFVFNDKRQVNYQGNAIAPPIGESKEIGFRFNFGKKFQGSIGYYDSQQENNPAVSNSINNAMRNIYDDLGLGDFGQPWDTQTVFSEGWEIQLVANPSKAWSIRANVAIPEGSTIKGFPSLNKFWDENSASLYSAAAGNDVIAGELEEIEQEIAILESDEVSDSRNNKIVGSLLTRYTFQDGLLDGFMLGGGLKYRGKRLLAGTVDQLVYADPYAEYTLFASYKWSWSSMDFSLQVNVSNPLDDANLRYRSLTSAGLGNSYRLSEPQNVRTTLTVRF